MRNKDIRFARYSTTVIGLKLIRGNLGSSSTRTRRQTRVANSNRRRIAANSNSRRIAVAKAA